MVRTRIFMSIVGVILLSAGITWAGPNMNPGKWEITTKTEMAGMPAQSLTHTQCITNDDLVPMSDDANNSCQVKDIKIKGNTVSWKITCGGQGGQMDGTGRVTYDGDTMDGKMEMVIKESDMKVTNHITGRRIGECDGQENSSTMSQTAPQEPQSEKASVVEETVVNDTKDVGKAAKDEAKQSTIDEVRKGVRGLFKKVF